MPTPTVSRSIFCCSAGIGLAGFAPNLDQSTATCAPTPIGSPRFTPPDNPTPAWVPDDVLYETALICTRAAAQGSMDAPGVGTLTATPTPTGTLVVLVAKVPEPCFK